METSVIESMIGIPLNDMFIKVTNQNPAKLAFAFREYYGEKGIFQAYLLPGIKTKLNELKEQNFTMGIITSKKQELAHIVTEVLNIQKYFDYIIGETEDTKDLGKFTYSGAGGPAGPPLPISHRRPNRLHM